MAPRALPRSTLSQASSPGPKLPNCVLPRMAGPSPAARMGVPSSQASPNSQIVYSPARLFRRCGHWPVDTAYKTRSTTVPRRGTTTQEQRIESRLKASTITVSHWGGRAREYRFWHVWVLNRPKPVLAARVQRCGHLPVTVPRRGSRKQETANKHLKLCTDALKLNCWIDFPK